eukprot:scaffold16432_cov21-Tisochrysis_lutea.AAC.1
MSEEHMHACTNFGAAPGFMHGVVMRMRDRQTNLMNLSAAGAIATFAFCRNSFPWPLHGCLFNLAIFAPSPYVTGAVIFPLAAAPWATALASTWWRPPPLWYPTVRQPRRRRGMMSSGSTACRWGGSYCSVRIWEHMMSSGINACRSGPVV